MKGKFSALYSKYIIDGVCLPHTPAQILDDCLGGPAALRTPDKDLDSIVDETTDPSPSTFSIRPPKSGDAGAEEAGGAVAWVGEPSGEAGDSVHSVSDCLEKVLALSELPREVPMAYSGPFTMSRIAKALLDSIWKRGRFRLCDLILSARWRWNPAPLGNMAAFYSSVEAVSDFLGSLGISLGGYSFLRSEAGSCVQFKVGTCTRSAEEAEDDLVELPGGAPFGSEHPVLRKSRALPATLVGDPESWVIFVPFDSCDFRLGSSLLSEAAGSAGDTFPDLGDGDYFIDCFELVREFVEDGVLLSGATVGDGGLLAALKKMCVERMGADIDIGGLMGAYGEEDRLRILFGEVPGVLLQVKDIDYDYLDAEFLLQDIAYYPVGHPAPGTDRIQIKADGRAGISSILESLLSGQALEGED